jgi:hypothetical protein
VARGPSRRRRDRVNLRGVQPQRLSATPIGDALLAHTHQRPRHDLAHGSTPDLLVTRVNPTAAIRDTTPLLFHRSRYDSL